METALFDVAPDCEIKSTRVFGVPPQTLFDAWTDPDKLKEWWGPAGFTNGVLQAHQTLQVSLGASPDEVKRQFRKLTLTHHPDVPSGSEEKMKAIIGAYEEIKRYWQLSEAHAL